MRSSAIVKNHLLNLPEEILLLIASYCDVETLVQLVCTSKWLRIVLGDDAIWQPHFVKAFGNPASLSECLDLTEHPHGFYMPSFFRKQGIRNGFSKKYSSFDKKSFSIGIIGYQARNLFEAWSTRTQENGVYNKSVDIKKEINKAIPDLKVKGLQKLNDFLVNYKIKMAKRFFSPNKENKKKTWVRNFGAIFILLDLSNAQCLDELKKIHDEIRVHNKEMSIYALAFYDTQNLSSSFEQYKDEIIKFTEQNDCHFEFINLQAPMGIASVFAKPLLACILKRKTMSAFDAPLPAESVYSSQLKLINTAAARVDAIISQVTDAIFPQVQREPSQPQPANSSSSQAQLTNTTSTHEQNSNIQSQPANSGSSQPQLSKPDNVNHAYSFWTVARKASAVVATASSIGLLWRGYHSLYKKGNHILGDKVMLLMAGLTLLSGVTYSLDDLNLTAKKEDNEITNLKKRN